MLSFTLLPVRKLTMYFFSLLLFVYHNLMALEYEEVQPIFVSYSSRNQTWQDTMNDSTCSVLGLGVPRDTTYTPFNIQISESETYPKAWVGAHVEEVWMNFEGCYYGTINPNSKALDITNDSVKNCFIHCKYGSFALTEDKCLCSKDVYITQNGCTVVECPGKNMLCGYGRYFLDVKPTRTYYCMCHYTKKTYQMPVPEDGQCMVIVYHGKDQTPEYRSSNCFDKHHSVCVDTNTSHLITSEKLSPWLESVMNCYKNYNKQFTIPNQFGLNVTEGIYWLGSFSWTLAEWGYSDLRRRNTSCVAVDLLNFSLVVTPCRTLLPALCLKGIIPYNTSADARIMTSVTSLTTIDEATEESHSILSVSTTHQQTSLTGSLSHIPASNSEGNVASLSTTVDESHSILSVSTTHQQTSLTGSLSHIPASNSEGNVASLSTTVDEISDMASRSKLNVFNTSPVSSFKENNSEILKTGYPWTVIMGSVSAVISVVTFIVVIVTYCLRRQKHHAPSNVSSVNDHITGGKNNQGRIIENTKTDEQAYVFLDTVGYMEMNSCVNCGTLEESTPPINASL